jgi:glucuronate isomerase
MASPLHLHPDRLFPAEPGTRAVARRLFAGVEKLPIISPHGHTDAKWFAENEAFSDPAQLLIVPDHYLLRMLYSQGVPLTRLGVRTLDGSDYERDPRAIWRTFAAHYHLFRGTPSRLWLDWVFAQVFGLSVRLEAETADHYYEAIDAALQQPEFRPRALFDHFDIEVIATTEGPLDTLDNHSAIAGSGWHGRVITTYRPDAVVDPEAPAFAANVKRFGELTSKDMSTFEGYLAAHRTRRLFFRAHGATATDHGHPTANSANLAVTDASALYDRVREGTASAQDAEIFRAQMLTEMASMSIDDGMVMQIHPGVWRNHNDTLHRDFGPNVGADIPLATDFVAGLKPLLDRFGDDPRLTLILFTLDETSYARELAPLAGHYPALRLGPPWWFNDSPEGMRRFREQVTETAGFSNLVGFNDDTRAFLSIPARHDVARRADCAFLAGLVVEHRLDEDEAAEIARGLAYDFAKAAYKL